MSNTTNSSSTSQQSSTTQQSSTGRNRRAGRTIRTSLALAAAAGVAAGLGGFGMHAASAESAQSFGTSNLMQSQDIGSVKDDVGELNSQTTSLYGATGISACTGEDTFDSLTGNKNLTSMSSTWSNSDGETDGFVTESIAQAKTPKAAKAAANKVVAALRDCQTEPSGHWHYGKLYNGPLKDGDHVWMDAIDGDGTATGGIAVMLQGNRFGVVEVTSAVGDGDDAIKNVTYEAEPLLGK